MGQRRLNPPKEKNPSELLVMGANPSRAADIVLPTSRSIEITIRIDSRRLNSVLLGPGYSPGIFGRRYSSKELLELNRISEPEHVMGLLTKAGGDYKKMAKMSRAEIEDIQKGHWARRQGGVR